MFLPLLTAAALCGQTSTHSLGVGATALARVGYSAPVHGITLEGTWALRRGVELYLRVPLYEVPRQARIPNAPVVATDWATGSSSGVRGVALDGPVRPWVGAHLSNLNLFRRATFGRTLVDVLAGGGVSAGLDVALPAFTLSARGSYDALLNFSSFQRVTELAGVSLLACLTF